MKKLRKVPAKEVKRSFVIQNLMKIRNGKKKLLKGVSKKYFDNRLKVAKRKGLKMTEKELDQFIFDEYPRRHWAYNTSNWYLGEVTPNEVGVWQQSGGLPLKWTNGSLKETAEKVKDAIQKNKMPRGRAAHAIPNLLKTNVDHIQKEKYLLPIVFKHNFGTRGRHRLKRKLNGDIDDGCMRSISLTVNGAKSIKSYIGFPKNPQAKFHKHA